MNRIHNLPIRVAILGAGGRGWGYGQLLKESPALAQVVGVAEPRDQYRELFVAEHQLAAANVFNRWEDFIARPVACDAVVISTQDRDHRDVAIRCLEKGWHVLLEKPMATTLDDCRAIERAQHDSGKILAVCHSLRYQKGFQMVKQIVASGRLGRIITIDQLEQVAYWHQAHSFVRGNWGNAGRATFMLLAKSCHDIDYLAYLVDTPCVRVSSFGALTHFRKENAPPGSTARCTDDCQVEATCQYSAIKHYVRGDLESWPANVVSPVHTAESHLAAIRTGPYGRCVYQSDNDVVDHQVVLLEFADDVTATFTMTAFTRDGGRRLRIHGTDGELAFDEKSIVVKSFKDGSEETISTVIEEGGHGGGDARVVQSWLGAIANNDASLVLTNAQASLKTHTIVFAAEQARHEKRVVELNEYAS